MEIGCSELQSSVKPVAPGSAHLQSRMNKNLYFLLFLYHCSLKQTCTEILLRN